METGFKSARCPITNELTPNVTLDCDKFHISYNTSSREYGYDTTAIVIEDRVFFILNGNHCIPLKNISNDISKCIDYFIDNIHNSSKFSEHLMVAGIEDDVFSLQKTVLKVIGQTKLDELIKVVTEKEHKR